MPRQALPECAYLRRTQDAAGRLSGVPPSQARECQLLGAFLPAYQWRACAQGYCVGFQSWQVHHAGEQFDSRKASAATVHFPSSQRDAAEKLYISAEHEKSGYGRDSPGACCYNHPFQQKF